MKFWSSCLSTEKFCFWRLKHLKALYFWESDIRKLLTTGTERHNPIWIRTLNIWIRTQILGSGITPMSTCILSCVRTFELKYVISKMFQICTPPRIGLGLASNHIIIINMLVGFLLSTFFCCWNVVSCYLFP